MTAVKKDKAVSQGDARIETLHNIAIRLAEININAQLEVAIPTLEFLEDIEDKTADDVRKLKDQEKFVDLLESQGYRDRLQNVFAECYSALEDKHLEKYLSDLVYEEAISEVNFSLLPELEGLHEELLRGVIEKPNLQ